MARKENRKCIVCSKKYSYCPSCEEDKNKEPWHVLYCSDNCKTIFETASDFLEKAISKEAAKEKFDKCDLTNKIDFHHKISDAIDMVYGNIKKTNETKDENTGKSVTPKMVRKSNVTKNE